MSMFGESKMYMEYFYDDIEEFFENGGILEEFFEILYNYFKNYNNKK